MQLVFLRTETKKSLKRLLCSNFKSKKELLLVTELCSFIRKIASIFLDTYSLNVGLLSVLGLCLFQILFQMHSFSNNKPNIMARHNVIYIKAWCARDDPLDIGCTRYATLPNVNFQISEAWRYITASSDAIRPSFLCHRQRQIT